MFSCLSHYTPKISLSLIKYCLVFVISSDSVETESIFYRQKKVKEYNVIIYERVYDKYTERGNYG